jgi:hypothetical protein
VERFLAKHADKITGVVACFDRVNFKGYLPLNWPEALERLMADSGVLIKDFKEFTSKYSRRLVDHAQGFAKEAGRPYEHLNRKIRKEDAARAIAERDGVTEGLVCVFGAIEPCSSFAVTGGKTRPRIVCRRRKCLHVYYYFIHPELGFLHVRLQTWFPFTIQVCMNGHEVLARAMDREGIAYCRADNAFLSIEDPEAAQALANRIDRRPWHKLLAPFARTVNPLLAELLRNKTYHWVTDQAEFALDICFRDPATLRPLYERLVRHAVLAFSAEDVLTFLGRKLHPAFAGEVLNDYKRRWPGARVKHRMKENWIKLYDKHGSILRIEIVINRPREFKIRRHGTRHGQRVLDWFPMPKGVAYLPQYAKTSLAAARRYLDALAIVDDPAPAQADLRDLTRPVRRRGRTYRGFNPADEDDVRVFAAVLRGEHMLQGFRNRHIREHLSCPPRSEVEKRRQSARVTRLLQRLHARGLIAKVQRTRRWRVTTKGIRLMGMAIRLHHETYPQALLDIAA